MLQKYKISLYTGSLINASCIDNLPQKVLKKAEDINWGNLIEVTANLDQIKEIQKFMVKHYQGPEPWYLDGENTENPVEIVCAFGADDGEGGKIFIFDKYNLTQYKEIIDYGLSKGIPIAEMDFLQH